jgi:hypothetical protein
MNKNERLKILAGLLVDTRQWKPGWYIATLKTQTKTLESVRFIISD